MMFQSSNITSRAGQSIRLRFHKLLPFQSLQNRFELCDKIRDFLELLLSKKNLKKSISIGDQLKNARKNDVMN